MRPLYTKEYYYIQKFRKKLKVLNVEKFKIAIKEYIEMEMPLDRINTYRDYS